MKKKTQVRKDGKCLKCEGARPVLAVKHGDPFCSTECFRAYHGTEYVATSTSQNRR